MSRRIACLIAMLLAAPLCIPSLATPKPAASASAAPKGEEYYAYANYYYAQFLGSRDRARQAAKDPYHFFNFYYYYRERYGVGRGETLVSSPYFYYQPRPRPYEKYFRYTRP